ncbi:hypothetical protein BT96DRAFT_919008 [Gymnopus androsaceus JB14]|uniref:Uncharacterized protein n=1 Tax=Gymnopus androsaceus JB14 TaxID=1447944 RepID=A0A6A4HS05_9AGAR|nr:hypothetical protein BT96DRAFT_919008 [Gymnopus androsaceus JB14]
MCEQYLRLKRADSSDPRVIFVKEFPGMVDVGSDSERKSEELGMDFETCGHAEFPDRKWYAIQITSRTVQVGTGSDEEVIVAASSSGAKAGLRSKWGGGELRSRGKMVRQGSGWTMESNPGSPAIGGGYGSYTGMPVLLTFSPIPNSQYLGYDSVAYGKDKNWSENGFESD